MNGASMQATKSKRPKIRISALPKIDYARWYSITVEGDTPVNWVQQGKPTLREVMARVARVERELKLATKEANHV